MSKYAILWTRLSKYEPHWLGNYINYKVPKPVPLEGNGFQYYFAVKDEDKDNIIDKLKRDNHQTRYETTIIFNDNINIDNYDIGIKYGRDMSTTFNFITESTQ